MECQKTYPICTTIFLDIKCNLSNHAYQRSEQSNDNENLKCTSIKDTKSCLQSIHFKLLTIFLSLPSLTKITITILKGRRAFQLWFFFFIIDKTSFIYYHVNSHHVHLNFILTNYVNSFFLSFLVYCMFLDKPPCRFVYLVFRHLNRCLLHNFAAMP